MVNMTNITGKAMSLGLDRGTSEQVEQFILNLNKLGVQGVDKLRKKLKKAPNLATFRDYWLEGTYACIFAESGLLVSLEPCGSKGPDMLISINKHNIYVEVTHLRLVYDQTKSPVRAVAGKIRDKLTQTLDNEINMVILHSDRRSISKLVFYKGIYLCRDLCRQGSLSAKKFKNLSCVIMDMPQHTPQFGPKSLDPFYWRFLRTSEKKVPSEVKRRINEIFKNQTVLARKRLLICCRINFFLSLFC